MDESELQVTEDIAGERFELRRANELVAYATYHQRDDRVIVPHIETSPRHRGNGHAARLMNGMLDLLDASGRTITPLCPFAAQFMSEHPEREKLLTGQD